MIQMNYVQNRSRLTDIENRLVVAKGAGTGTGWGSGVSKRKIFYVGWINNKSYCRAQGTIFNIL